MSVIVQQTVAGSVFGWSTSDVPAALTQTFTFTAEADITSIMIYSQRSDAPDGVLRCTFDTLGDPFPYTFDISSLTIPASQGWATVTLPDYFHAGGGTYQFSIRRLSGSGLLWRANLANPYAGGIMTGVQYPTDYPPTAIPDTWDSMFIVNGDAYPAKPTNPAPADTAISVRLNTALFEWEAGT